MTTTKTSAVSDTGSLQRLVRANNLQPLTGYSPTYIYELMAAGKFPKPIKLAGGRAVAWLESEIVAWQHDRIAERDSKIKEAEHKKTLASSR